MQGTRKDRHIPVPLNSQRQLCQDSDMPEKAERGHFLGDESYSQWEGGTEEVENLLCFCTLYCTSFKVPKTQRKKLVNNVQFLCYLLARVTQPVPGNCQLWAGLQKCEIILKVWRWSREMPKGMTFLDLPSESFSLSGLSAELASARGRRWAGRSDQNPPLLASLRLFIPVA